jgi:hypothetical protein
MVRSLGDALFGRQDPRIRRSVSLALAVGLFVVTFVAYALDVFAVAGGVVFVPGQAALVGVVGAAWVGYRRRGLVFAWLGSYGALLGYLADHYFLGLPHRSLWYRATSFVEPDGLAFLGAEALVIGTIGFLAGLISYWGVAVLRDLETEPSAR